MITANTNLSPRIGGLADEAIAKNRFVCGNAAGTQFEEYDADPAKIVYGVSQRAFADGNLCDDIITDGIAVVDAGDAFVAATESDHILTSDSSGRAIAWTPGSGLPILGIWLPDSADAAIAAGNPIKILLTLNMAPQPVYGTATIALGDTTEEVAVNAKFNGRPVICSPQGGFDDTATEFHGAVADGTLTITANAAATAAVNVNYIILP